MPLITPKAIPPEELRRSSFYLPLLAYLVGIVFLAVAGYRVFWHVESLIQREKLDDLSAIATTKIGQIVFWRESQERRGAVISAATLLAAEFEQWGREGAPAGARRQKIAQVMDNWRQIYGYRTVVLVDRQGAVRLGKDDGMPPDAAEIVLARQAMDSRRPVLSDIHNVRGSSEVSIDLVAPLIVQEGNSRRVVGAAIMQINPADFLFPLVQTWPTHSSTAETLLVRQEGDDLLFLNVLRHRDGKALTLRLPANTPNLPPGMFLRGKLDPLNSVDYRGVPVVAEVFRVPGTPWLMVAKIDKEELFAPIRQIKQWAAIVGLVFLVGSSLLFVAWLQNALVRYRHLKAQRDAAVDRELLLKHFEYLTKFANDIIFVADENGNLVEANERAVSVYGYTRDELLTMKIRDLRPQTFDFEGYHRQMAQVWQAGELIFETTNRRKDGSIFQVEVSARVIKIAGKTFLQGILRDITERKAAERRILRLNDLYAAISKTDSAIVRIKDRAALFQGICNIAVEHGHFRLAWIGLADAERGCIEPVATSGTSAGYLDGLTISLDPDKPEGQGPTGVAFHKCHAVICKDFETDPRILPWRDKARQFGLRSSASWPLMLGGKSVGVLNLYAGEANYFDDEIVSLLLSISQDISFALENMAMQESLCQSEEKFRTLVENLPQRIFLKDVNSVYVTCNDLYAQDRQMSPEEIVGKTDFDFYPQELAEARRAYDRRVMAAGKPEESLETYLLDGQERYIQVIKAPFKNQQGEVVGVLGVFWDVTERKLAEEQLNESYHELEKLTTRLEVVREDEQKRIARELHDEMGGVLAGLNINVSLLAAQIPPEMVDIRSRVADLSSLVTTGIESMRRTVAELRPSTLDEVGLVFAIERYVVEFMRTTEIECDLRLPEEELTLDGNQSTALYRIVQESLTNVAKYAQASKVSVVLSEWDTSLMLTIKDNGTGFDMNTRKTNSFGLIGIRERAAMVGGKADITSAPGKGTMVRVSLPLAANRHEQDPGK